MEKNQQKFHLDLQPARLDVEGVTVRYGSQTILNHVSFQIPHGGRVAVVGPNGAGKSTLFKALVGLLPLSEGRIMIHGLPLGQHQDCVAYIPQREDVDWRFPVTVADVVMMGRYGRQRAWRQPGKADQKIVLQSLDKMGISNLADKAIGELSGGQQQRAFIARALAQEPHILLMDEPFAGVDISTQEATLQLLDQLQSEDVTVLVSTHDLDLAARRFDKILLLNRRVIAYGDAAAVFTPETLREAFSGQVLFVNGAAVIDQCCPHEDHSHEHSMESRR